AVALREALINEDSSTTGYRGGLTETFLNRGLTRRALGDLAGAAADVRRALAIDDALPLRTGVQWFVSACSHAALAGLAGGPGSNVSDTEAANEAEVAMVALHHAIDRGYR